MSTKYTFIAENKDTNENIVMSVDSDTGTWAAPMELFFRFLKAQGYIFRMEEYIGVMNADTGNFRGPSDFGGIE